MGIIVQKKFNGSVPFKKMYLVRIKEVIIICFQAFLADVVEIINFRVVMQCNMKPEGCQL
jgi:hypothetical protein